MFENISVQRYDNDGFVVCNGLYRVNGVVYQWAFCANGDCISGARLDFYGEGRRLRGLVKKAERREMGYES